MSFLVRNIELLDVSRMHLAKWDCRLVQRLLDEESRGEGDLSEFVRAPEALQN